MNKALGLLETKGFTGLAVATDAMLKSASVELLKQVSIGGGFVNHNCRGCWFCEGSS